MHTRIDRRTFLRTGSALATAMAMPTILPRNVFGANEKLNIATIGALGKGQSDTHNVADLHNIVALVDADMNEESTKLKALQTQQQLGIQSLSIANSNSENILSLFR